MKILGFDISRKKTNALSDMGASVASQAIYTGWGGNLNSAARTQRSNLANEFASVNAIVDEVYSRDIFAADENGNHDDTNTSSLLRVIERPNSNMNKRMFFATLISGILTLPQIDVLVWHLEKQGAKTVQVPGAPDGGFTEQTISGFSILPRGSRTTGANGAQFAFYFAGERRVVGAESVVTLRHSILPDDGVTGISPGSATATEADIMDRLAIQQRAYFDNGAKPDVMVKIHARTAQEAENFKKMYMKNLRGSRAAGGTLFSTVLEGADGGAGAWMEVEPVATTNHGQDIPAISQFAQNRVDGAQGVSPLMYGRADAASYNNQQTAKSRFYEKVDNLLARFFDNFQQELERVTGAPLSFRFGWTIREIEITDEKKTQAETRKTNVDAFVELVNAGATPSQAAEALGLPEFANVNAQPAAPKASITVNALNAPKDGDAKYFATLEKTAKDDSLFLSKNAKTGAKTRVADRQTAQVAILREHLLEFAKNRVANSARKTNELAPSDQKHASQIVADLLKIAENGGTTAARQIAQQIQSRVIDTHYEISANAYNLILARANNVLANFAEFLDEQTAKAAENGADTPRKIGQYVFEGDGEGATLARIEAIKTGESRYAFLTAQVDNGARIADEANVRLVKTWNATSAEPCEFCASMNGKEAGVRDAFVPDAHAQAVNAAAGGAYLRSDYSDGTIPDAHANCQCVFEWKIEENSINDEGGQDNGNE